MGFSVPECGEHFGIIFRLRTVAFLFPKFYTRSEKLQLCKIRRETRRALGDLRVARQEKKETARSQYHFAL